MTNAVVSRRSLLGVGAAAGLYGLTGLASSPVLAKGPFLNTQAPTFFRFKLGSAEATIISDGILPLGDPHAAFLGISPGELDSMLTNNFLPVGAATLEQNILVLNTGEKIIIFDNGMGVSKLFGDTTGKMLMTLKQAGIEAKDVDALVMTHAHIDHCGGVIGPDGKPSFPNAELFISEADFTFWTDETKVGPTYKAFYEQAVRNLVPVKDRITFFKDGQEFLPGVQAMFTPGHTVGHTIFLIQSGKDQLCYIGDISHHPVLLIEKPLIEFAYDTDPKQAAKTRVRVLDMLASNRIRILGYHFPWPGIGHIGKAGDGFRYFPTAVHTMDVAPI
ncbi:MBL fold metallo-hydrolase [Bradyrhizobium sp. HKCCYLRH3099]|uniref:MBL fold metallo-hydrolase n=1 Tax=unclassified Bradyrhizobium TaxID=2631580 RepID=UPI003EBA58F5